MQQATPIDKAAGSPVAKHGLFRGKGHTPMMAMIEITNHCNMSCPVCFADANHPMDEVPFDEVDARVLRLLEICEFAIPIQISGGEPTLHPELIGFSANRTYHQWDYDCTKSWLSGDIGRVWLGRSLFAIRWFGKKQPSSNSRTGYAGYTP